MLIGRESILLLLLQWVVLITSLFNDWPARYDDIVPVKMDKSVAVEFLGGAGGGNI